MTVRIRIPRSATEWLWDLSLGALLGLLIAVIGLAGLLALKAPELSPTLARLLRG